MSKHDPGPRPPAVSRRASPWARAVSLGLGAARANLRAAIGLWCFGAALLLAYYATDPGRDAMDRLAEFRQAHAIAYAMGATALCGGLIPWCFMRARPSSRDRATAGMFAFMTLFWAEKGVEVHFLYEGLARLVGEGSSLRIIITKVAIDQGVYVPLWASPSVVLAYRWQSSGYRWRSLGAVFERRWWFDEALPITMMNIAVWTPAVAMIYALPLALQLPAQNLVLCFWSLLLLFMTDRRQTGSAA